MNRFGLLLILMFSTTTIVSAQQRAVTELGEEVILFSDGTWRFANQKVEETKAIPTNPQTFEKDKTASFMLKSKKAKVGFWLDPKQWSFQQATDNPDAEYDLQLKGEDLFGMIITEKMEIPLESLKSIAFENGRAAAPDLEIVKEEYRNVNGIKVLCLQMNGTLQGIKFAYYGYYYSNEEGTVQFITFTSQQLLKSYEKDCEKLLNGLVSID